MDVSEKFSQILVLHPMFFRQWSRKLKMVSSKSCKWQKVGKVLIELKKTYPFNDAGQSGLMNTTTRDKKVGFNIDKIMYIKVRTIWDERVLKKELLWKGLRHLGHLCSYIKWKTPSKYVFQMRKAYFKWPLARTQHLNSAQKWFGRGPIWTDQIHREWGLMEMNDHLLGLPDSVWWLKGLRLLHMKRREYLQQQYFMTNGNAGGSGIAWLELLHVLQERCW